MFNYYFLTFLKKKIFGECGFQILAEIELTMANLATVLKQEKRVYLNCN